MEPYGLELILDLHDCDVSTFTRKSIKKYFRAMCKLINVRPCKLCWWDDKWMPWFWKETESHIKGTTAIQFLTTSDIRLHTLDLQRAVRLNIFSCDDFDADTAANFTERWFSGRVVNKQVVVRY